MRRFGCLAILAAALSAPVSAGDITQQTTPQKTPQNLNAFIQQRGLGTASSTPEEWCQLAFLAMTSPQADEQTRAEINIMARNRNCYTEAHPSEDEATRAMICKSIPALLSQPGTTTRQKLSVMDIARANKCIR
jgi:hypothetical protein